MAHDARRRSWSLAPDGGFWRADAYLELRASYYYAAAVAEVDQYVVLEASGRAQVYRTWNRGYTPQRLAPVLERAGLRLMSTWGDLEGASAGSTDALGIIAQRQESPRPTPPHP